MDVPAQFQVELAALGNAQRRQVTDLLPAFPTPEARGAKPLFLDR
jgi:hypothetical protein